MFIFPQFVNWLRVKRYKKIKAPSTSKTLPLLKKKREGGNDINQDYLRKSDTKTP